jgi:hypothetical protein
MPMNSPYISPSTTPLGSVSSSGAVASGALGANTVYSGNIASGQIGLIHVQSGFTTSGLTLSGAIGSGQIDWVHHISGYTISGLIKSGGVGSGQVSTYHHASGAICQISQFVAPLFSGNPLYAALTQETISGIRAVAISQSGNLYIAMAAVSGRGPAVGVVVDNVLSGIQANVYTQGIIAPTSGLFTAITFFGQPLWVGRSGHVVPISGSFCSGGWASGDYGQKMGIALPISSGGILLNVNTTIWSGGPLGESTGGGIL